MTRAETTPRKQQDHPLKKVLLIAGRYRAENPYLELAVKRRLEAHGIQVILGLPTRAINPACFPDEIRNDPVFQNEGARFLESVGDFVRAMRGCQLVLFSSWKGYAALEQWAAHLGRLTMDFNALVGLDHYGVGRDLCLIKSPVVHRLLLNNPTWWATRPPLPQHIRMTGSILYEDPEGLASRHGMADRQTFCRHYGFDPERPIAVLFPKAIIGFRKKVRIWFKDWTETQIDEYNQWFLDHYLAIAQAAKESGCNFMVKLHPSSYASYWCRAEEEYDYWNQYPWIKILDTIHTHPMFHHMDVGLGINTHSAMDTAYFGKPFIYVEADRATLPSLPGFHAKEHGCTLHPGPSSHWHENPTEYPNPWFSSWLGYSARLHELPALLRNPATYRINPEHQQRIIAEFWHRNDGGASAQIVQEVMNECAVRLRSPDRWRSPAVWRGSFQDFTGRVLDRIRSWRQN
ncbi:MAG: hypothetical protein HQL91_09995 [Magnetococcales bacterium]|nr:hypothetical protein [Magnetococcales bacterium]